MGSNLNKELRLARAQKKDTRFIYQVVKEWLEHHADHSVITLKMPSFAKFSKTKTTKYIIKKGDMPIGFVHILANNEIGYYVIPEFQGMGLGTWAVIQLMKKHPRERYYATVNNKNIASVKLITSLGFKSKATIYEKIGISRKKIKR